MARKLEYTGIDIGRATVHVAILGRDQVTAFENTPDGHKKLASFLKKHAPRSLVVLEATGVYGLDLALRLHGQKGLDVRYINPAQSKAFAQAILGRAKTDSVDARMLASLGASMELNPWVPPSERALGLRAMTRRVRTLVNERTREKNRLDASRATDSVPDAVRRDITDHIRELDERIERLRAEVNAFARQHDDWAHALDRLITVPGIADATAVEVLAELACMPPDLTARQAVAQAGLDPRPKQSGGRDGRRHISKMGTRYLRAALYVAAINTVRWCPEVAKFHATLVVERKKLRKVAYVAVARKLLHTIMGMLKSGTAFDPSRFYNPSTSRIAAA